MFEIDALSLRMGKRADPCFVPLGVIGRTIQRTRLPGHAAASQECVQMPMRLENRCVAGWRAEDEELRESRLRHRLQNWGGSEWPKWPATRMVANEGGDRLQTGR